MFFDSSSFRQLALKISRDTADTRVAALNMSVGVRKPNFVSPQSGDGNHSSCPRITPGIEQSTQKHRTGSPYPLQERFSI
jgi:hypothetical protein